MSAAASVAYAASRRLVGSSIHLDFPCSFRQIPSMSRKRQPLCGPARRGYGQTGPCHCVSWWSLAPQAHSPSIRPFTSTSSESLLAGPSCFATCDLTNGWAYARISPEVASDHAHLQYHYLEQFVYLMLLLALPHHPCACILCSARWTRGSPVRGVWCGKSSGLRMCPPWMDLFVR